MIASQSSGRESRIVPGQFATFNHVYFVGPDCVTVVITDTGVAIIGRVLGQGLIDYLIFSTAFDPNNQSAGITIGNTQFP